VVPVLTSAVGSRNWSVGCGDIKTIEADWREWWCRRTRDGRGEREVGQIFGHGSSLFTCSLYTCVAQQKTLWCLSNIGWSDVDVDKELEKQCTRFALGCAEFPITSTLCTRSFNQSETRISSW
jgi:hypothetical protein